MRILIAHDEVSQVLSSPLPAKLAKYGSIDIVQNGRAAVIAYVNSAAKGAFYDLIVVDQQLTVLDGFAAVDMIRLYETEHRKSGKRTMVCVISGDESCSDQREVSCSRDDRTQLLRKPTNLDLLESLAVSIAAERDENRHIHFVPMHVKQPASPGVWSAAH